MKISIVGQATLAAAVRECCRLHFDVANDPRPNSDLIWVCYDTPIGVNGLNDAPDVPWVLDRIRADMVSASEGQPILISSQLPVGTTKQLEQEFPKNPFAYSPENIRVASAVSDFKNQARIIVGVRYSGIGIVGMLNRLFHPFTDRIVYVSIEEAEMAKHALNCWLGMNIAFANEIDRICDALGGIDGTKVMECLLSERRISPYTPIRPGAPFGGGHLARDIFALTELAKRNKLETPIIAAITASNSA